MKTIYTFGISFFTLALFSCTPQKASTATEKQDTAKMATTDTTTEKKMIGGDKDEHGCLIAAGYSWSVLKQDCIRPFELKTKLKDLQNSNYAGYLLFSSDNKQAEVFAVEFKPSIVLDAEGAESYIAKDNKYKMTKNGQKQWVISKTEAGKTAIILQQE
ncbi:hypothetical protein [Pedobacter gandavensis]|uniref:Lipoprotein n=1 Tax=Pedobacter gandavensis TaxID=2679963 RepID=A0ABR6ESD0_9SPHI|nr:hypothetical protein [Pedobacter gandavensis]MBB2148136.1 hypothetical protein [Pedobacter gandavensis]